jgi:hypothetical protein
MRFRWLGLGVATFVIGFTVSSIPTCPTEVILPQSVCGSLFIPYGLGLMILGIWFVGFGLLPNVGNKEKSITENQLQYSKSVLFPIFSIASIVGIFLTLLSILNRAPTPSLSKFYCNFACITNTTLLLQSGLTIWVSLMIIGLVGLSLTYVRVRILERKIYNQSEIPKQSN